MLENYMRATVAGYNGMNDEMIDILKNKPAYHSSYPFYYMDFLLGLAKMRRLDPDAEIYFKIFTVKYKGKHYIKSAYRNLSWLCQTKNDKAGALTYYSLCRKYGSAVIEEDKQAEREAAENLPWPAEIIKARLLFDGKYYDQSIKILKGIKEAELTHIRFTLEFLYRKARIAHERNELAEALKYYEKAIEKGKKQPYYFAAYSALQEGFIYEKQGNFVAARKYFIRAKNDFSENKEYANAIEQKAKAGLKRLEKTN
jgi:tetratricopeptide (TPR) repeat protein